MKQSIKNQYYKEEPKLKFSVYDYNIEVFESELIVYLKVDQDTEKEVIKYKLN